MKNKGFAIGHKIKELSPNSGDKFIIIPISDANIL